ncbi:hypothetical protein V8E54_000763 [Elaphomyces granulatus]
MARHSGKKKNGLEGNEFLFSGKKFRVSVPEDLHVLKDRSEASEGSKACKYRVADIIHLPAWKNGAMTSAPALEKLVEPLDELSDKRSEEDSCQPHVRLPKVKVFRPHINNPSARVAEAPIITSKEDWIALDEDTVVRPTVRCPGYMDRDISALREEIDDELNEEDTCRSRIPITDDQSFQPLVRLSRNDGVRRYRSDNSYIAGIPEAPVTASRDRIIMDEDLAAGIDGTASRSSTH